MGCAYSRSARSLSSRPAMRATSDEGGRMMRSSWCGSNAPGAWPVSAYRKSATASTTRAYTAHAEVVFAGVASPEDFDAD